MRRSGFTLLELIIVVALVGIVAVAVLVLLNPWSQIGKGNDARRKHDLDQLRNALEDYYNDKGCYPQAEMVCYDVSATNGNVCQSKKVVSKLCHICGSAAVPTGFAAFQPYMKKVPCDPEHPAKDYLYEVDRPGCGRDSSSCQEFSCTTSYCPKWFRVYSGLNSKEDSDSKSLGCYSGGCGPTQPPNPTPAFGYDYGIYSPNIYLENSTSYQCTRKDGRCNACGYGGYQQCVNLVSSGVCASINKIYSTYQQCCSANPGGC